MKFVFLKFCYAVEIGAYLAYRGHYDRTKDKTIRSIKADELRHMVHIKRILAQHRKKPNRLFNIGFLTVGHLVRLTCKISPIGLLDRVARFMELFNIFSYTNLALSFPEHTDQFEDMACQEAAHELLMLDRIQSTVR